MEYKNRVFCMRISEILKEKIEILAKHHKLKYVDLLEMLIENRYKLDKKHFKKDNSNA